MAELITLTVLATIGLFIFRLSSVKPLENPLMINRVGQFHAVLAPRLNLAQPLLEHISRELGDAARQQGNSATLYFSLEDQEVQAHGTDHFLLAITLRDGLLYFQACSPQAELSDLNNIRQFAETELVRHPETGARSSAAEAALLQAVRAVAGRRGTQFVQLQN
jgi:hypothetical protein